VTELAQALILNRFPVSRVPYRRWLGESVQARMITSPAALDARPDIEDAHVVDDYDATGQVEDLAVALYRERPYDHIVAMSEYDILRAARLREFLGVPGQDYQSALAFRDKVVMKDYWSAVSLPVTPYASVDTGTDLLEFAARHGFPVVVKPRRAAGSRGVSVLRDHHQLSEWLAGVWSMPLSGISGWMAEKFVDGQMLHVDGLLTAGGLEIAWPSTLTSQLAFQDGQPTFSVHLDAADPAVAEARAIVEAALQALPCPGLTIFHAEIWRLSDSSLALNEIASRLGGGRIRATIAAAFGTDMAQRYVQGTVMPDCLAFDIPAAAPRQVAGFVTVPPGQGTVAAVLDIPGWLRGSLVEASVTARPGQAFTGSAASAADSVAACVATGRDRAEVLTRLSSFAQWSGQAISYGSSPAGAS
jgi:ATP-grasp domain